MKRIFVFSLLALLFYSCDNQYQPREINKVEVEIVPVMKGTSIRAIQSDTSSKVYFAASNGYGTFDGKGLSQKTLIHQDSIELAFRSIASNGSDLFILSIANPALLYKIDLEGKSSIVYKEEHEKVFYDSMKFFDSMNGIAMGDPTEDCLSIIRTKDGGNTWSKIPCDKLPKVSEGEAAFAASNTNIKVLGKTAWIVTGGAKARVFKTIDLGESWEVFDTPIIQGNGPQGIYSVDFADENNGIIIGGDYSKAEENKANKAITKDGGKTWTLVADGLDPNYRSCVQYVPNTNGQEVFAVGKTGISYSADGGKTWKKVSGDSYYTIQFVNRNFAWLAGSNKLGKLKLPL